MARVQLSTLDGTGKVPAGQLPASVAFVTSPGVPYNVLTPPGGANYAGVMDGNSHPLSGRFASLAAAQAVFPRAAALTEEIDRHALQYALDTQSDIYLPPDHVCVCDMRAASITQVAWTASGGGAGTVTITAPNHGYTATDVSFAHTVMVGGFTADSLSNDWSWFTQAGLGYAIASVPDANTLTFAITSGGPVASIATNPPSGTTAAVRLKASLFTRSGDSGTVYGNAGESAVGLGNQRITMGANSKLRLRAGTNNYANSGAVLASGNVRAVSNYSSPTTSSFCPKLTLDVEVDGNNTNAGTQGAQPGILLIACNHLIARRIEAYAAAGTGCIAYGTSAAYTFPQTWEVVRCYNNGYRGLWTSLGMRRVSYVDVKCWGNGTAFSYTGSEPADGAFIDHSEAQVESIAAWDNAGAGIIIHNVYDHNIRGLWARGNGGHGIWVIGLVASNASNWYASCNGKAATNTYDDIHFDSESDLTYGVSKTSRIAGIVCGFDDRADYTNKARYSLWVDTGMGDIHIKDVRYLTAGNSGTYHGPASGTAGANGGSFLYVPSYTPKVQVLQGGMGILAQAFDINASPATFSTWVSQDVRFSLIPLNIGDVVTNILFNVEAAPGTPANLTDLKVGLFTSAGVQLGVSADTPAAGRSAGPATVALLSPYTAAQEGVYYAALWMQGTSFPTLTNGHARGTNSTNWSGAPASGGRQQSQADMPSPATIGTVPAVIWLGAN